MTLVTPSDICLPVREGIVATKKVGEIQEYYTFLLQQYEKEYRPNDCAAFARFICKLPELSKIR